MFNHLGDEIAQFVCFEQGPYHTFLQIGLISLQQNSQYLTRQRTICTQFENQQLQILKRAMPS